MPLKHTFKLPRLEKKIKALVKAIKGGKVKNKVIALKVLNKLTKEKVALKNLLNKDAEFDLSFIENENERVIIEKMILEGRHKEAGEYLNQLRQKWNLWLKTQIFNEENKDLNVDIKNLIFEILKDRIFENKKEAEEELRKLYKYIWKAIHRSSIHRHFFTKNIYKTKESLKLFRGKEKFRMAIQIFKAYQESRKQSFLLVETIYKINDLLILFDEQERFTFGMEFVKLLQYVEKDAWKLANDIPEMKKVLNLFTGKERFEMAVHILKSYQSFRKKAWMLVKTLPIIAKVFEGRKLTIEEAIREFDILNNIFIKCYHSAGDSAKELAEYIINTIEILELFEGKDRFDITLLISEAYIYSEDYSWILAENIPSLKYILRLYNKNKRFEFMTTLFSLSNEKIYLFLKLIPIIKEVINKYSLERKLNIINDFINQITALKEDNIYDYYDINFDEDISDFLKTIDTATFADVIYVTPLLIKLRDKLKANRKNWKRIFKKYINFMKLFKTKIIYALPDLFYEYWINTKKPNLKEFYLKVKEAEKNKIIGNILPEEYVKIDNSDKVFKVIRQTFEGVELEEAITGEKKLVPFSKIRLYNEKKEWRDIKYLRKKKIYVVHVTNAFDGGSARQKNVKYHPIRNIIRDIENEGKYVISCSSISKKYRPSIVKVDYSLGVLLKEGQIYAAYPYDATTRNVAKNYREGSIASVPVEVAIRSNLNYDVFHNYNELLVKDWKVGGIFFTPDTPKDVKETLIEIAKKYKKKLYEIDPKTKEVKRIYYKRKKEI